MKLTEIQDLIKFVAKSGVSEVELQTKDVKIIIKTNKHQDQIEITVADTGIGIPENEREQIFGRYYKANNFTDLKNSTGLGLAIIKKILDLHQSSLELVTEVNTGSAFIFRLPVYQNS